MAAREAGDPVMKPNWVSRPGLAPNEPAQLRILDSPVDDAFPSLTSLSTLHPCFLCISRCRLIRRRDARKLTRKYNSVGVRENENGGWGIRSSDWFNWTAMLRWDATTRRPNCIGRGTDRPRTTRGE